MVGSVPFLTAGVHTPGHGEEGRAQLLVPRGPGQGQAHRVGAPGCWVSLGARGVRALFARGSGELGDSPLLPRSNPRILGFRGELEGGPGPPGAVGQREVGAETGCE